MVGRPAATLLQKRLALKKRTNGTSKFFFKYTDLILKRFVVGRPPSLFTEESNSSKRKNPCLRKRDLHSVRIDAAQEIPQSI